MSMVWTIILLFPFKVQIFKLSPVFIKMSSWSFWSLSHGLIMSVGFLWISMACETVTSHSEPLVFNVRVWEVLQELSKHVIRGVNYSQSKQFLKRSKDDHGRHDWFWSDCICNCDESHRRNDENIWSDTQAFHCSIFVRRIAIFHSIEICKSPCEVS